MNIRQESLLCITIIKMRKGQIEIMGLVIIVILLVMTAIFALTFIIKPKQTNDDILKLKANSLRSSILKTELCSHVSVKDEIENCIDGFNECIECSSLHLEIEKIIKGSLENERYSFTVLSNNGEFIKIGNCLNGITSVDQSLKNGKASVMVCRR